MRGFARAITSGAIALTLALSLAPAHAETPAVDTVFPQAVPTDIAEIRTQPAIGPTSVPVAAGQQPLTPQLLANYIERQKALHAFDAFGIGNGGELTEDVLLGYIARGSLGGGNGALQAIESFTHDTAPAAPTLDTQVLAAYVSDGYVPTSKRVQIADKERDCLAQAIYHEARGESANGQLAVANIIVNRANSGRYPGSLCGVIYQNADKGRYRCQFTFACDGRSDAPRERRAWARSKALAADVYAEYAQGEAVGSLPKSALFYHTTAVSPSWSHVYNRVAQIGSHIFYSPN